MHEGHRNRLIGKIKDGGVVYEHEMLEILLFNSCPRKDLNAVAHSLIAAFGSLAGVLNADPTALATVEGVGENMAEYIACLGKSLSALGSCNSFAVIRNTAAFKEFLSSRPVPEKDRIEMCMLDKDGRIRRMYSTLPTANEGELLKVLSVYHPYGLFVSALRAGGGCQPRKEDDELVKAIDRVSKLCATNFFDYCIAAGGEVYSYRIADRLTFGTGNGGNGYGE